MPLFDGEPFVMDAVRSVLDQDHPDFELVVVDDGSRDTGPERVERLADPRVRIHRMGSNGGIARALNAGVSLARAPLIARMDADDLSHPRRLSTQERFLHENPGVVAVGSSLNVIDESGEDCAPYWALTRDQDLRRLLVMEGPFAHGSVMFRRSAFEASGGYRSEDEPAEDYALWVRMASLGELGNIPERLYTLRISSGSVSARNRRRQLEAREAIRQKALALTGEPRLRTAELHAGRRYYACLGVPEAPLLAERFRERHQELAAVLAARRGLWVAAPDVLAAARLSLWRPRTLKRMYRFYQEEAGGRRRGWT